MLVFQLICSPCSAIKFSKASVKVALVASQKSIRSSQPLRSASKADELLSSSTVRQHLRLSSFPGRRSSSLLTPSLDPEMHFRLGRMRNGVAAKLHIRTVSKPIRLALKDAVAKEKGGQGGGNLLSAYFFMMKKRSALPRVWSSFSI